MALVLHVNVDHVATLRQARGMRYPDPVEAALLCERAGAAGITVHLREDRRHIVDRDVRILREVVRGTFNLEMAATPEMVAIARAIRPDHVTLVPERREERTTEGGLDVAAQWTTLRPLIHELRNAGIFVSLFVAPVVAQIEASLRCHAGQVELHTGEYAHAPAADRGPWVSALASAARAAHAAGLRVAAGHGLTMENVGVVAAIAQIEELNIGHAIVSDAVVFGMARAVRGMLRAMRAGRRSAR